MKDENKIVVSSSTKNLSQVRAYIEEQAGALKLDEKIINQIILSVDEACTNIIKYTHKFNENNKIEVRAFRIENNFNIEIIYYGDGFDPNQVQSPDMMEYFRNYKVGGLGIPMIRKFMNKIEYQHILPDTNKLVLIKSL